MAITNGYATLDEVKAGLSVGDTDDDTALERAVEAASRQIDGWCGRRFYEDDAETDRYFTAQSWDTVIFKGDPTSVDATSITTVALDTSGNGSYVDLPSSAWTEGPKSAAAAGLPYTFIRALSGRTFPKEAEDGVKVTGTFGWASVPAEVQEACILQAERIFKRIKEAPFGMSPMTMTEGEGIPMNANLDLTVRMLLAPYRKPRL